MAAEGRAHFARWFVGDGDGGGQQCCLWVYRRGGRGGAISGLGCKAETAQGIVAVFAVGWAASAVVAAEYSTARW